MNKPVSIFIVTYLTSEERCAILKRTCESALAQNYPDFEVVVSDNGGALSAHDALASIQDPRLKIFRHTENVGFTGNINRCIELCSHDVIKPICDDDLIHPDFLAQTVPHVDDRTLVMTDLMKYTVGSDPEAISRPVPPDPDPERRAAGYGRDIWTLPYSFLPSAMLYTRELFRSIGGFDAKSITSDWDFFIEACIHRDVVHVRSELCYVGVWEGSLTEEMLEKPYFFPIEGLYTKLRIYHCKQLPSGERRWLLGMLLREWIFQSVRPFRNAHRLQYWRGSAEYTKRFFRLLFPSGNAFNPRPINDPSNR